MGELVVFGVNFLWARIRDKGVDHLHKRTTSDGQGGLLLSNNSFKRSRGPFDHFFPVKSFLSCKGM